MKINFCFVVALLSFQSQSYGASHEFISTLKDIATERVEFYGKIHEVFSSERVDFEQKFNLLNDLLTPQVAAAAVRFNTSKKFDEYDIEVFTSICKHNQNVFRDILENLSSNETDKKVFSRSKYSTSDIDELIQLIHRDRDAINSFREKMGLSRATVEDINLDYIYLLSSAKRDVATRNIEDNLSVYLDYATKMGWLKSRKQKDQFGELYKSRSIHPLNSLREVLDALVEVIGPERTRESRCAKFELKHFENVNGSNRGGVGGSFVTGPDSKISRELYDEIVRKSNVPSPFQEELKRLSGLVIKYLTLRYTHLFDEFKQKSEDNEGDPLTMYISIKRILHICAPIKALNDQINKTLSDFKNYESELAKERRKKKGSSSRAKGQGGRRSKESASASNQKSSAEEGMEDGDVSSVAEKIETSQDGLNQNSEVKSFSTAEISTKREEEEDHRYQQWFKRWLWKEGYSQNSDDEVDHEFSLISLSDSSDSTLGPSAASASSSQKIRVGRGPGIWISEKDKELLEVFAGPRHLKQDKYRFEEFETLCKHFGGKISKGRTTGDHVALVLPDPAGRIFKTGSFHPSSPKMPAIVFDHFMKAFRDAGYLSEDGKVIPNGKVDASQASQQ